jgi:AcrR family transcriptional regulator
LSRKRFKPGGGREQADHHHRLPPALARLPEDRVALRGEFLERNRRDRILLAAFTVFGTKGSATATIKDVIDEASVSRATFYKLFADKDACLLALVDEVSAWLSREARDAARDPADWVETVAAVTGRLVALLLDDRLLAQLCRLDFSPAGEEVRARRGAALEELVVSLRRGRELRPWGRELPRGLEAVLVHGALALATDEFPPGDGPDAKALGAELSELILIPYIGEEDARRAVRSSRPRR